MTNYFWSMTETLKETMMLKHNICFGLFLWIALPFTIVTWLSWVIADKFLGE